MHYILRLPLAGGSLVIFMWTGLDWEEIFVGKYYSSWRTQKNSGVSVIHPPWWKIFKISKLDAEGTRSHTQTLKVMTPETGRKRQCPSPSKKWKCISQEQKVVYPLTGMLLNNQDHRFYWSSAQCPVFCLQAGRWESKRPERGICTFVICSCKYYFAPANLYPAPTGTLQTKLWAVPWG